MSGWLNWFEPRQEHKTDLWEFFRVNIVVQTRCRCAKDEINVPIALSAFRDTMSVGVPKSRVYNIYMSMGKIPIGTPNCTKSTKWSLPVLGNVIYNTLQPRPSGNTGLECRALGTHAAQWLDRLQRRMWNPKTLGSDPLVGAGWGTVLSVPPSQLLCRHVLCPTLLRICTARKQICAQV